MPKLTIDNVEVEVPAGTNVLEAARSAGIVIPHFCYHQALEPAGACRLCAMRFLEGPVRGIQMSCMIPAQDGMVVSTDDPEAVRMRSLVIEWLMLNHPHDCPVCDEGGECLLQDFTVAGGHGIRRFRGKKRTFIPQHLGEFIEHEMNRCIACYRCVRFYQEYAGGSDFGVMGSSRRVYFGRDRDGALQSPFSGNLVDICPTGVFTDRTARFRARYWDYEMAPSVCPHCSLGCATVPAARYRELLKTMARHNEAVNGWFICDRGRFSNGEVNAPDRPRTPRVDGGNVSRDEALDDLVLRLEEVLELYGGGSVALVGSPRLSLEGGILLVELARVLGADALCFFPDSLEGERTGAALSVLAGGKAASLSEVRNADAIVILNCNLLEEGPMMLLAVRQAWRKGAPVFLVGKSSPLAQAGAVSMEAIQLDYLEEVPLGIFLKPVVIFGTRHNPRADIEDLGAAGARFAPLLAGPNAFGAALLTREHGGKSLTGTAAGRVKAIIAVEADIGAEILERVPLVASLDWRPSEPARRADIFLPTTAWTEMDGTFINNEGRAQRFRRLMTPGFPIRGLPARYHAPADKPAPLHPPRSHCSVPPGADAEPAWQLLAKILERLGGERVEHPLAGKWEKLRDLDPDGEGVRVT